jgi:DNA-directed RNA polymerase sigma subunit (sigma70/sigma32)
MLVTAEVQLLSEESGERSRLMPPEQRVLELMSGLTDGRRYSIPELARHSGMSEDDIIRILQSAKRKLRPPPE